MEGFDGAFGVTLRPSWDSSNRVNQALGRISQFCDIFGCLFPGENLVSLDHGGTLFLGFETDRHLRCVADSADPAVTGLRMQLFRLESSGPVLVARTPVVPARGMASTK